MPLISRIGSAAARGFGLFGLTTILDPFFKYVTLLLHGNGTNGAQNNTFLDSSTNNFTITRNGNTTQGTFTPYGANWSNYCGSSNNFSMNGEAGFAFGSSADFTIQFWFLANTISADVVFYDGRPTTTQGAYPTIYLNGSTKVVSYVTSSAERITGTTTISTGTWYNVVLSRVSGTTRLFVNGTSQGSWADTTAYANPASRPTICVSGYAANGYLDGYISNLSVLNGTGYTTVTVPTTPLLASTTNQILLLGATNRFIDANTATTAKTINITGSPSIQRFSPFSPSAAYSTSVIGGSGYFDGSGDYLTAAQNAAFNLGTAAFTVEAWIDLSTLPSGNAGIITLGNGAVGGSQYCGWGLWVMTNGTIVFERYDGTEVTRQTSNTITLNQWNHIVAVRDGSSNFAIFINGVRGYNAASATTAYNNVNADLLYVGRAISGGGATTNYLTGYIGDVRVVAGTAVYSATSTTLTVPTAPLTAITNTSLLLSGTNGGIFDNAEMNNFETVGSAQISTSVYKYGTGSMSFNGAGAWLVTQNRTNFNVGSGDFTVEAWIYTGSTSQQCIIGANRNVDGVGAWMLNLNYTGRVRFFCSYSGGTVLDYNVGSGTISDSAWHHVAATRNGSSLRIFVDGTQVGTTNTTLGTAAIDNAIADYRVGSTTDGALNFNGYIDDLRITKGYARYTANFTPPTTAFPNQ